MFGLSPQNLHDLNSLELPFLAEHSDILFKFVYWRSAIDGLDVLSQLLRCSSRLLTAINTQITEVDVILLMRTFLFILERFKGNLEGEICEILSKLFRINQEIQENTLQFWINYIMNNNLTP